MNKTLKITIIAIILIVLGIVIGGISLLFISDNSLKNVEPTYNYAEKDFQLFGNRISIRNSNYAVNIVEKEELTDSIHVEYYVTEGTSPVIHEVNGTITVESENTYALKTIFNPRVAREERKDAFNKLFKFNRYGYNKTITIAIPSSFSGTFMLSNGNGLTNIDNISAKDNIMFNLENGIIRFKDLTINNNCSIDCNNGELTGNNLLITSRCQVELDNGRIIINELQSSYYDCDVDNGTCNIEKIITKNSKLSIGNGSLKSNSIITNSLDAEAGNGIMTLSSITADIIEFDVDNGIIKGTILGNEDDYSIAINSPLGKSTLKNKFGGSKRISGEVDNGILDIKFN